MEVKICYGRGGWSWYTGSSSWYYRCGIENILGMRIEKNSIFFKPCIPDNWEDYFIQYKYKTSIYNIKVINKNKSNKVQEVMINGKIKEDKYIKLIDNNKIYNVEILL